MVFLWVLENLQSLKTRPIPKLLPRFCGPFKILKQIGEVSYKPELPLTNKIHPIFHVSKLKRTLRPQENIVFPNILVELIEPLVALHELEKILGFKDRRRRHNVYKEALVKWKYCEQEAST